MNAVRQSGRNASGFSLMEMVLTIVLLGFTVGLIVPIFANNQRTFDATTASQASLSKLRYATERMARELREVRRNPASISNFQITMGASSVTFTKTDGVVVTLQRVGSNILVSYSANPALSDVVLTNDATALTFSYFDMDGGGAPTPATVAYVDIDLQLTVAGSVYDQRTRVALRNQI